MTNKYASEVVDRGIYGFAVSWYRGQSSTCESAMPDKETALKCAAVDDLAEALQYVINSTLASDKTWNELRDKCRAALAKAGVT